MLTIKMKLVELEYEKLAKRFIPEAFMKASEDTGLTKRLAGRLFVKDGESSSFTRGLLKLIPNQVTNSVAYHLILSNQSRLQLIMNQALEKSLQGISVNTLRFLDTERAERDMLKLEIELNEVDYNSVIGQLLPKLLEGMSSQSGKTGSLGKVIQKLGEKPDRMLAAALDILTQEEKDTLMEQIVDIYREDIIEGINHAAEQQKIAAVVSEIRLSQNK